jgi:predicted nucleotidyltransferase
MTSEYSRRKEFANSKLEELREKLAGAQKIILGKACVYATGSFGRGEASAHSDLDLFIVGKVGEETNNVDKGVRRRSLSRLDEICLKAELIKNARAMGFPEFSQDGRYIVHFSVDELIKALGTPEDDAYNTFTARMLLLLESRPVSGEVVYHEIVSDVVAGYWRDFEDHSASFVPAFFANDVLRYWRTLCINYEVGRTPTPEREKAKSKLKNYKLRHSRMLTCYSALLYLLDVHRENGTVTPENCIRMIALNPIQRIEALKERRHGDIVTERVELLLNQYEIFLQETNNMEETMIQKFSQKDIATRLSATARNFGDTLFKVMTELKADADFYRLLVV